MSQRDGRRGSRVARWAHHICMWPASATTLFISPTDGSLDDKGSFGCTPSHGESLPYGRSAAWSLLETRGQQSPVRCNERRHSCIQLHHRRGTVSQITTCPYLIQKVYANWSIMRVFKGTTPFSSVSTSSKPASTAAGDGLTKVCTVGAVEYRPVASVAGAPFVIGRRRLCGPIIREHPASFLWS
ncbi:hypothetical protein B0H65DRAFT_117471 [Neurospora tetraspora]|uniref:Uncharacterized protein n=1 Tax=Neurospora tetraspora TaxID=94610 RepID=A0AAE0JKR9_9PEZI|nr:hypothetical protein B0H65DRAFT_117471 [Neurospora tetraspora]